jgi:dienelactone hydrolase
MEDDELAEEDLPLPASSPTLSRERSCSSTPGDGHLFADNSLPDYDESAATMLRQRVLAFLAEIE